MLNLNFNPFPVIDTERLVLRQLAAADAAELFYIRTHPDVLRYTNMAVHQNVAQTQAYIELILGNELRGESIMWAMTLKDDPKIIGTICFWNIEPENDLAEIGYILDPDLHGKGLMGEAVSAVVAYGFDAMKLQTIIAELHKDNLASVQLLIRRGFVKKSSSEDPVVIYTLDRN